MPERRQEAHQATKGAHLQAAHQAITEAAARHQEGQDSAAEAAPDLAEAVQAAAEAATAEAARQEQEGKFHTSTVQK